MDVLDKPNTSLAIRIIKFFGFSLVGLVILSASYLGADNPVALGMLVGGISSGILSIIGIIWLTRRANKKLTRKKFIWSSFLGVVIGNVLAKVIFTQGNLIDNVAFGVGAGLSSGFFITLAFLSLRAAVLSFSVK